MAIGALCYKVVEDANRGGKKGVIASAKMILRRFDREFWIIFLADRAWKSLEASVACFLVIINGRPRKWFGVSWGLK